MIMKIKLLITTTLLLSTIAVQAQTFDTKSLEVNNLKISVQSNGDLHRNSDLTSVLTECPAGSGLSSIYAQSLWLGGYDENNELSVAANTYRQNGNDFYFGPVATTYNAAYNNRYNNVWHLTRDEIELHINNYSSAGYIIPDNIESWPGNGIVTNGEAQNLAPYEDINNNDLYEPELGEHPLIRGDEALFVIYNDDRVSHTESLGNKFGAEIHLMLYAYSNSEDAHHNNVVYSHYEIYNRSELTNFSNLYVSSWLDFELGDGLDDYVGTHTTKNMIYTYNGSALDGEYGNNPPAYGYMLLNESLTNSMIYSNSNDFVTGNPNSPSDYYYYMKSFWRNASPLINPIDSSVSPFVYPGNSDTLNYANWSEINTSNLPSDQRMIASTLVPNFDSGDKLCFDFASIYARDTSLNPLEQIENLFDIADDVQNFYNSQYDDCNDVSDLEIIEWAVDNKNGLFISQNNNLMTINAKEPLNQDLTIRVIDVLGKSILYTQLQKGATSIDINLPESGQQIYFIQCHNSEINKSIKVVIN